MNKLKRFYAVITAAAFCAMAMSGCDKADDNVSSTAGTEENASSQAVTADTLSNINIDSEYFDSDDLDTVCDNPDAEILLKGNSADINGKGAESADGKINITQGGTYIFSGVLTDGQIHVNTKDKVHIALNGADISCSDTSPVFIEDSDKTVITVCDNTENKLTGCSEQTDENGPDAVIFSKDDLSLNGGGSLTISAEHIGGITCKNDLRICGTAVNITSAGNAVKGKDSIAFMNTVINAESQSDGLKSTNTEKDDKGFIVFESGEFNITAAQDAVQAETDLIINGGVFNLKTGNSTNKSSTNDTADNTENKGNTRMFGGGHGMTEGNPDKTEDSEKGLRAGRCLSINDGTITADCADDTMHSNGKIEINNGTIILSSGDDGIHADEQTDINGGEISVLKSYEGIEAAKININDGKLHIKASDDGFNASDGSDSETSDSGGFGGKMGGFGNVSENCELNINGGYVYVNADGDGLDSNGTMNITGGTTIVDGPVNDGNGALDTGIDINVSGGTLIAAGSSGMAEVPSEDSAQYSVAVCFEQQQEAGSLVWLSDESGKNIAVYAPSKVYSSVVISTPDIKKGNSYSVYYGGKCSGKPADGVYTDGECSDGTLLGTEKADSSVTQIGTGRLGMTGGGMGGHGGMKPPDWSGDGEKPEKPDKFTPPDGFDGNMTPPDGFDGNMTPPDGFDGNMTPPDGFDGNMAPPDGFDGNMAPPNGFGGNMAPPNGV